MNNAQIAAVLYNTGGLLALWVVVRCWRDYKTDKLRQDVFDLRAELFRFASEGGIAFDNHSYRLLRRLLNSMIRFAHELSFVRFATTLAMERLRPSLASFPSFAKELESDNITDSARAELTRLHNKLMNIVSNQILTTSIAALPVLLLYVAYTLIRHGLPERNQATHVDSSVRNIVLDKRLNQHMQLMEQQAIETREMREREALVCL